MNSTPTPNSPAPVDIARLRELLAKATPGPLVIDFGEVIRIKDSRGGTIANLTHLDHQGRRRDANEVEANATFIAALRNDAPALLDEVERLREQVVQQNTRNANAIKEGLRYLDERDKLREEVERLKATNECAVKSAIEQAEQVIRLKEVRESLRQQNERLIKEIEELKSRPTGLWKENQ